MLKKVTLVKLINERIYLFFFLEEMLSCPESESSELEEELELELELEESEEESEAWPELDFRSMLSAIAASSGCSFFNTRYHFLLSFGRPRTVLCQTMGKLVLDAKFCVTAMVVSKFKTTCQ